VPEPGQQDPTGTTYQTVELALIVAVCTAPRGGVVGGGGELGGGGDSPGTWSGCLARRARVGDRCNTIRGGRLFVWIVRGWSTNRSGSCRQTRYTTLPTTPAEIQTQAFFFRGEGWQGATSVNGRTSTRPDAHAPERLAAGPPNLVQPHHRRSPTCTFRVVGDRRTSWTEGVPGDARYNPAARRGKRRR